MSVKKFSFTTDHVRKSFKSPHGWTIIEATLRMLRVRKEVNCKPVNAVLLRKDGNIIFKWPTIKPTSGLASWAPRPEDEIAIIKRSQAIISSLIKATKRAGLWSFVKEPKKCIRLNPYNKRLNKKSEQKKIGILTF